METGQILEFLDFLSLLIYVQMSMAATPSTMTELGRKAPQFALPDVLTGQTVTLGDFERCTALLVMFICKHCPYVLHVKPALIQLAKDYANQPLGIVSVCSNDAVSYPDDAPERIAEMARELPFPLLYDETQEVAKAYRAACTPDFFLFDSQHRLVYRGQADDSRPGNNRPLTGRDLRAAIDAVLAGKLVKSEQRASVGCNIKWKPGNEPDYY
jgi:thiol-disulfide isomerase/thioredoxin